MDGRARRTGSLANVAAQADAPDPTTDAAIRLSATPILGEQLKQVRHHPTDAAR